MAGAPINPTEIDNDLFAQGSAIAQWYEQVKAWLVQWQANCPDVATMNALGYTNITSQQQVMQHIQNLATWVACFEGTQTAPNAHDMMVDVAKLKGLR